MNGSRGWVVVGLGLWLGPTVASAAGVHCRPEAPVAAVNPGDTIVVAVTAFQADGPFNAFDASVRFDPSRLSFVPPANPNTQRGELMTAACPSTFHLFAAAPDSLLITLSLMCSNTSVTGPGVIYRVRFVARSVPGPTTITLGQSTQFFNAGFFVNPLDTQPMTICIGSCATDVGDAEGMRTLSLEAPQPNPLSGSATGRFRFTLPAAATVTLELFDLQGRRVARRPAQAFPAGPNEIAWATPALAPGLYLVRMQSSAGESARRLWTIVR